jgi:hypothetical protein
MGIVVGLVLSVPLAVIIRKLRARAAGPAAKEIADAYLFGPIHHADLRDCAISSMAIMWRGRRVNVEWYSTGRLYGLSIDGNKASGMNGPGISMVLSAAKERARKRAEELLNDLNGLAEQS